MTFTPTPEQVACITAATADSSNLLISALAGAAKTSTLVMIAEALSPTRMLCLAFNKKIATEMQERLPANCEAKTLNSLGYSIWRDVAHRRGSISTSKNYDTLYALLGEIPQGPEKKQAFDSLADYMKILSEGKTSGWIPDSYPKKSTRLISDVEFFSTIENKLEDWEEELIIAAMTRSLDAAFAGDLDFDDQILMPTVFPAPYPRYPVVLIDEAQDLSPLNHQMLRRLVGNRRIIAVGDPCQAIYGFRGASENSMDELEETFSMKKLLLSVSFRCPRTVVEHARWRAPRMEYPEWAKPGEVRNWHEWKIEDLPSGAAVICRNNAPLFSLALKLLRSGRYAQILGNDIGKNLIKILRKFGDGTLPRDQVMTNISIWLEEKKAKSRNHGPLEDRAACLRLFADSAETLAGAIAFAEHIFNADGPLKLMTGHKSKGLEFDDVFILEEQLIRNEGQDRNLRYVMQTRAKNSLTYIDFDGLDQPENLP